MLVAGFIGSPQMNFVKGRLEGRNGAPAFVAGQRQLPLDGYAFAGNASPGQEVVLGVRPEHLETAEAAASPAAWPGFKIDIVEPMGADTVIWCSDGAETIQVRQNSNRKSAPGERLALQFDPAQVSVFAAASGDRL